MSAPGDSLLRWYRSQSGERELPWRDSPDPWAVWVSEVMLQQTTVSAVKPRFLTFLERFPDPSTLATATEEEVLAEVQGLGYYRRFRGLHRAARALVEAGGELPRDAEGWKALPGVGDYTAGAIASIAQGQAVAAVDGNVLRVMARLFGIEERIDRVAARRAVEAAVMEIMPREDPGAFNQALFDLGREVCRPRNPSCEICPVAGGCRARLDDRCAELPFTKPTTKAEERVVAVALLESDPSGSPFWERRSEEESRMPGFWQLPEAWAEEEGRALADLEARLGELGFVGAEAGPMVARARHAITRYKLDLRLYLFTFDGEAPECEELISVAEDELDGPRSTISRKLLEAGRKRSAVGEDRVGSRGRRARSR